MERMLQSGIKDSVFSLGCFVEVVICAVGEAVTGACERERARQTKPGKQDGEGDGDGNCQDVFIDCLTPPMR